MMTTTFPITLFSLTAEEFSLLLFLLNNSDYTQPKIHEKTGLGIRKTAKILNSLREKGFIDYKPGHPTSAKVLISRQSSEGKILTKHFQSKHLLARPNHLMTLAYLATFMGPEGEVIKKRREIEAVVKTTTPTMKRVIQELIDQGFIQRTMLDKSKAKYKVIDTKGPWF